MSKNLLMFAVAGSLFAAGAGARAQTQGPVDWSGVYLGLNGGWHWADTDGRDSTVNVNQLTGVNAGAGAVTVPSTAFGAAHGGHADGFMGGGQIGFNAQSGAIVWGLEGDFDGVDGRRRDNALYNLPATGLTSGSTVYAQRYSDARWVSTVRGRVGFALDRALIYGTGGLAIADLRDRAAYTYAPTVTAAVAAANPGASYGPYDSYGGDSGVRTGWTVGGGVEFLLARNVTVGAEYRHTEIGSGDRTFGSYDANGVAETGRYGYRDDAVLGRINIKFNGLRSMF